jgi:hypothetical protein
MADDKFMDQIKEKGEEFRERLGMDNNDQADESNAEDQDTLDADEEASLSEHMGAFEEEPSMNQPTFGERIDDDTETEMSGDMGGDTTSTEIDNGDYDTGETTSQDGRM